MARMTLLEMVQNIMSASSDFAVNSINDLEQSLTVAEHIKTQYYILIDGKEWAFLKGLDKLQSLSDPTQPTKLKFPDNVAKIRYLSYDITGPSDTRTQVREMRFVDPEVFLINSQAMDDSASNVVTSVDSRGIKLNFFNDRAPTCYTTFDNEYAYLDSYNINVESTVNGAKTTCNTIITPTWTMEDTFIPKLPDNMFSLLLEQSRVRCNFYMKEFSDDLGQANSKDLYVNAKTREFKKDGGIKYANWSRKR